MKIIICALLILFTKNLGAQIVFSGKITTLNNEVVAGANVILIGSNHSTILAFTFSDTNGLYKITSPRINDSIFIKVSRIGFAEQVKLLPQNSGIINFTLTEQSALLPEVKLQSNPITINGDTVSYNTSAFATQQDRFIGDVISRLPGIEIDPTGIIKYNGKPISNYYINGLDLLENRYSIANNNIPFDLVDKVQIFDNHQPILVLDSLKKTTIPALNISLKQEGMNRMIGILTASAGISPFLSNDAIVGMKFNNHSQFIGSYKYNNTGIRLANELNSQVLIQDISEMTRENIKENLLSLVSSSLPPLPESRYLFNDNHLFHLSALKVLKNKAQMKFNFGYSNDNNRIIGDKATTLFLPSDTISFIESINSRRTANILNGDFYYTLNKKNQYIKNASKIQLHFNNEKGSIKNGENVFQNLNNPFYQIENDFLMLTPIKGKLVSFKSFTTLNRTPQKLSISPGQFSDIFNQLIPYDRITQKALLNKFSSNNSIGFVNKYGNTVQETIIGMEYVYKQLETSLFKINNQTESQLKDSFQNKLSWQNIRLYSNVNTTFKINNKRLDISIPLELNHLSLNNKINYSQQNRTHLFINPFVNLVFPLSMAFSTEINYRHLHTVGNFTQTTPGITMVNYRTLNQNDTLLPLQKRNTFSIAFSYKNPLAGFFGNISSSYSIVQNNIIYSQDYNQIFSNRKTLYYSNSSRQFNISARVNKYYFRSKINVSLNVNYVWNNYLIFLQNDLSSISSQGYVAGVSIRYGKELWFNIESNTMAAFLFNRVNTSTNSSNTLSSSHFEQKLKLNLNFSKGASLFLNNDYYVFSNKNVPANAYYFLDMGIKFTYKKIDWEITCANITDNRNFIVSTIETNFIEKIQTPIRPRELLLKVYFKF